MASMRRKYTKVCIIFTARRYAKRSTCRRRVSVRLSLCVCVCVCVCVCLSHSGIV